MKNRIVSVLMCFALALGVSAAALAASEQETAAAYLVERGIFRGDENGNLNLDKGLTRAELAAILARIDGAEQLWSTASQEGNDFLYAVSSNLGENCKFTDVPAWASLYVSYCHMQKLMQGYSATQFGAGDPVNPKAICTVMLRWLGYAETDWTYDASVDKAITVGIAPADGFAGDAVLRGEVAIVFHKAMLLRGAGNPGTEPGAAKSSQPPLAVIPTEAELYAMAEEVVRLVNIERATAGLRELVLKPELMDVALQKSQDMVDNNYFGHVSPTWGGQTGGLVYGLNIRGLSGCSEILTATVSDYTAVHAMDNWMNSKEHRNILLSSYQTHIGVGVAYESERGGSCIWTVVFCEWTDITVDGDKSRNLPYIDATNPATADTPLKTK